ncbi:MAG: class F sortase [Nakamurella sp.]
MSRRQAGISLATGLVLLIAAPVAWAGLTPDPAGETVTEMNAAAARALSDPAAVPDVPVSASASAVPAAGEVVSPPAEGPFSAAAPVADPSKSGDGSATGAAPEPVVPQPEVPEPVVPEPVVPRPAAPVRLQLPQLGIDNPVIPVGVTDTGDLEIPKDVKEVGWYRFGPAPGASMGSAVLTGHVDDARQGAGPLSRLGELIEGDRVTVVDETGASRVFTVLAREEWSKSAVPMDRLFDRGGSPRLVLITCGGAFDSGTGHYEDNVAITAVPVPTGADVSGGLG